MLITNRQIVEALKVIKSVCQEEENDCPICPLGNKDGSCRISANVPDSWIINLEPPNGWRALK